MNQIIIGTTKSGLFEKGLYTLEDIEVTVEDRKFHDYTSYFQLYQHELENFRPSNLTFQIPVDQSIPTEPLNIEVNDRQVFSQSTGRSTQNVELTPQNADLGTGYNTIEFNTNSQAKYAVKNAEIQVRYSTNVRPAEGEFEFELTEEQLDYVRRDNTQEQLNMDYQRTTTTEPIEITLNQQEYEIQPQNGQNTVQIDGSDLQAENTMTLDSNQTFSLRNMEIVSE